MKWRKFSWLSLALAAAWVVTGCGGSKPTGVGISVSPTAASAITAGPPVTFSALITGTSNTGANWAIACASGVTAGTCGSITPTTTTGSGTVSYTAPATVPSTTSNGTTTAAPTVTITATAQADTNQHASATITIVSGISVSITPTTATVGTKEHFTFTATVTNPGCSLSTDPTCDNVTWSVVSTQANAGMIGANTGVYTADPSTVPSPSSVTIQAKSVKDQTVTATATVDVVTASTPTVTSVSPNTIAAGGLFQDVDITGTDFISTDQVYINCPTGTAPTSSNCAQLNPANVTQVTSSTIRARIPDFILANPPSNPLQIYVSEQTGAPQSCSSSDVSPCQIALATVRPGVVGASPTTVSQQSGGVVFNVNGGFFGTAQNPGVTATFNGQLRGVQLPVSGATNSTRQLSISIGGTLNPGDLATPGLFPVAVKSTTDSSKLAVTNLAVQPNYNNGSSSFGSPTTLPVGNSPSDVAIDPALGLAVVANAGSNSNSVSLINFAPQPPATPSVVATLCTAGSGTPPACPAAGPTSVAVDDIRDIALVVNSTAKTVAVVDLVQRQVTSVISGFVDTPAAVGVNPVTGRALVAVQSKSYGVLLDLTKNPPGIAGVVSISSGQNPRVAVEPHLNWAVATPGGSPGSLGIVDLSAQICIPMSTLSRTGNVVQVTVQQNAVCPGAPANAQAAPLTVQLNDAVFIQNASDNSFNGVYTVTAIGPQSTQFSYTEPQISSSAQSASTTGGTVNWSEPLFTESLSSTIQGIAIDPETQQAVLADPVRGGSLTFFSLIDQTSSSLLLHTPSGSCGSSSSGTPPADAVGPVAAAYNPLTNTTFAVNNFANTLAAVDPARITQLNLTAPCSTGAGPAAIAVDPGTNTAVIANQTDNSVTVLSLGPIRGFSIAETSPKTVVTPSTLFSGPSPSSQTITVIGSGFGSACNGGSTSLQVRLDGLPLPTTCDASTKDRKLKATVQPGPPNFFLNNARRFALDVLDQSTGNITNAEDFTVEQSVDVTSACASSVAPQPAGVAVDPVQNIAAVSLFGCNSLALIHLDTGIGTVVTVGTNPIGVAVMPRTRKAVTANFGSNNASLVDESSGSMSLGSPSSTGTEPIGAAADPDTENFAIANASANTVSIVAATGGGSRSISTGSGPVAVAFNYANNQVATAAAGSNALYLSDAGAGSQTSALSINVPTSVVYDPVPDDCSQTSTSTTIAPGCFLVNSSSSGFVEVFDPVTLSVKSSFKVGINATSLAYNYLTGTLVTTNTGSRTLSVADLLSHQIRAVFSLPSAAPQNANLALSGVPQFAVDIHPFRNLAVIADEANGQVLLLPLPH